LGAPISRASDLILLAVAMPGAICHECRHEAQLHNRTNAIGQKKVPGRIDVGEVVDPRANDDRHVVVEYSVITHPLEAELRRGLHEVSSPVLPKSERSMPTAK
jgi:hypothetical protein